MKILINNFNFQLSKIFWNTEISNTLGLDAPKRGLFQKPKWLCPKNHPNSRSEYVPKEASPLALQAKIHSYARYRCPIITDTSEKW